MTFQKNEELFISGEIVELNKKKIAQISHLVSFRDKIDNGVIADRFRISDIADKSFVVSSFIYETNEVFIRDENWKYIFSGEYISHVPRFKVS